MAYYVSLSLNTRFEESLRKIPLFETVEGRSDSYCICDPTSASCARIEIVVVLHTWPL